VRPGLLAIVAILVASGLVESSLTPWPRRFRMRLMPPPSRAW